MKNILVQIDYYQFWQGSKWPVTAVLVLTLGTAGYFIQVL